MRLSTARVVLTIAVTLAVVISGSPTNAQTVPGFDGAADNKGFHKERAYFSPEPFEHFDTLSGNIMLTFTDLVLPGNAGRELRFERNYNNQNTGGFPARSRWSFGFPGMVMQVQERAIPANWNWNLLESWVATTPSFIMGDGSWRPTVYTGDPSAPGANPALMEVVSPGFYKYDRQNRILRTPDGLVCHYDQSGRLTSFTDAFQNLVELEWSATTLVVRQHLSATQVRVVTMTLDPEGRILEMEYEGRHWIYEYGHTGYQGAYRDITRVTMPEELEWTFTYDDHPRDAVFMYEFDGLTSITTPNKGTITYQYIERDVCSSVQPPLQCELRRYLGARYSAGPRGTTPGTWQIVLDANGGQYGLHFSGETHIVVPSGHIIRYFHAATSAVPGNVIAGGLAVGSRTTVTLSGQVLESEAFDYTDLPLISGGFASVPTLQRTRLNRHGRWYTTEYEYRITNLGDYHHVGKTIEDGDGSTRTTTYTYQHFAAPTSPVYAVGLPLSERTEVSGESQDFLRSWTYNPATGFRTSEQRYGLQTAFVPDSSGNIASVTAPSSQVTQFTDYSWGMPRQIVTPLFTIVRDINQDGTVASETRGSRTTLYQYDLLQRPTVVQPPGGTNPTTTVYDNMDGATVATTRGSSFLTTTLDGFGRPVGTINSVGVRTTTSYDAQARVTYRSRPFLGTADVGLRIEYDGLGRVSKEVIHDREHTTDGVYREYTYEPGAVIVRDENGRTTLQLWEAFGHPDDKQLTAFRDAKQQIWTYEYNALGMLKSVNAPDGIERTWQYNDQALLFRETHPESGATTYQYAGGLMTQKTDAKNQTFVYTYDGNDRVRTITVGSEVTTFTYENGSDNVASMDVGGVHTAFGYDAAGRRASRQDMLDGYAFTTTLGYDNDDNVTSVSYPSFGSAGNRRQIGYEYDSEHRLTRVRDLLVTRDFATNFSYHPSGALTEYTSGNGVASTFTYDPTRYWMTSLNVGTHWSLQYLNYDGVGNVQSIVDSRAGMNQDLVYDELDRLFTVTAGAGLPSAEYRYDMHGNRTNANGTTYTYYPGKLRLWTQNTDTYTYDNNGNLLTGTTPGRSFTYTPWNRVASATLGGTTTNYRYDADDWRVKKSSGTTTTYFLRGTNGELLTEWKNPGTSGETRDYVYAGSRLVSAITRPWNETSDYYGVIVPDGPPVAVQFLAGQRAFLTFEGIAGHMYTIVSASSASICLQWPLSILNPNGTTLVTTNGCGTTHIERVVLPASGTYTVFADPYANTTGLATLRLYDITDIFGTIAVDGPSVPVTFTKPGQKGYLTFEGTASRMITIVAASSASICLTWPMTLYRPDGSTLATTGTCGTTVLERIVLPVSGTYNLLLDPTGIYTGTTTVTIYDIVDVEEPITLDAPALSFAITKPGQRARFTFTGTANQRVSAWMTGSNSLCLAYPLAILNPDASTLASTFGCGSTFLQPALLPGAGTYTVLIDPTSTTTGTGTIRAYDVAANVTGTLDVNGASVPLSLGDPGQTASLTFTGAASQQVTVRLTANSIQSVTVRLRRPDGSQMTWASGSSASFNLATQTLPTAGTYTVVVEPYLTYTGNITVAVTSP